MVRIDWFELGGCWGAVANNAHSVQRTSVIPVILTISTEQWTLWPSGAVTAPFFILTAPPAICMNSIRFDVDFPDSHVFAKPAISF